MLISIVTIHDWTSRWTWRRESWAAGRCRAARGLRFCVWQPPELRWVWCVPTGPHIGSNTRIDAELKLSSPQRSPTLRTRIFFYRWRSRRTRWSHGILELCWPRLHGMGWKFSQILRSSHPSSVWRCPILIIWTLSNLSEEGKINIQCLSRAPLRSPWGSPRTVSTPFVHLTWCAQVPPRSHHIQRWARQCLWVQHLGWNLSTLH